MKILERLRWTEYKKVRLIRTFLLLFWSKDFFAKMDHNDLTNILKYILVLVKFLYSIVTLLTRNWMKLLFVADDEGSILYSVPSPTDSPSRRVVLQQQWVTLTADMWPPEPSASTPTLLSADRLPVLAAVFCGAALTVAALCAVLLYKCCIVMPNREKHYCKYLLYF